MLYSVWQKLPIVQFLDFSLISVRNFNVLQEFAQRPKLLFGDGRKFELLSKFQYHKLTIEEHFGSDLPLIKAKLASLGPKNQYKFSWTLRISHVGLEG